MKRAMKSFSKGFMNTDLVWLMVCMIGILVGSLYGVSMKSDVAFMGSLTTIVQGNALIQENSFLILKKAVCIHLIQLLGIWVTGLTKPTRYLGMAILFFIGFNYGFSICGILMLYGLKGIIMSVLLFGIQAVALLFLGIMVGEHSLRYGVKGKESYGKVYHQLIIYCVVGAIVISLVDAYVQPFVRNLF